MLNLRLDQKSARDIVSSIPLIIGHVVIQLEVKRVVGFASNCWVDNFNFCGGPCNYAWVKPRVSLLGSVSKSKGNLFRI